MEYRFIEPNSKLSKNDKKYLREVSGMKRISKSNIEEVVFSNNLLYENQEKRKKDNINVGLYRNSFKTLNEGLVSDIKFDFNEFLDSFDTTKKAFKFLIKQMRENLLSTTKKFNLKIGNKNYALSSNTILRLEENIKNQLIGEITGDGSDAELIVDLQNADTIEIYEFIKTNKYEKESSAFFPYFHLLNIDLTEFQVYKSVDFKDDENCLINALKLGGINEEKLAVIKGMVKSSNIPSCKLEKICETLKIQIRIRKIKNKNGETKLDVYGKENKEVYEFGNLEGHAFIIKPTKFTSYSIKNYFEINHINEWWKIYKKEGLYYIKDEKRTINSFDLIQILVELKETHLIICGKVDLTDTPYYKQVENKIVNLHYEPEIDVSIKEVKPKKKKDKGNLNVFYDIETYKKVTTQEVGGKIKEIIKHIPYCCVYIIDDKVKVTRSFRGVNCVFEMLNSLVRDITQDSKRNKKEEKRTVNLIAHNGGKYDMNFTLKYLKNLSSIEKGSKYLTINADFNKLKFNLKDSLLLIPTSLKNFPKWFKLKGLRKEVMCYEMYDKTDCIERREINLNEGLEWIRKYNLDEEQFMKNILEWCSPNCNDEMDADEIKAGTFTYSCIEYAVEYCKIDCEILMLGYNTFKKWILELTNIDVDDVLTISSLSHQHLINLGCYEDCFELCGVTQQFIQKSVVGGRTMCANNEKQLNTDLSKKILDFDAVSLYPSAMNRMTGFLKGIPKVLTDLNYDNIKHYDGLFLEIKIKKVGKNLEFPLLSYIDEETGVRRFINEMEEKIIFIDKTGLEDAIKFQEIEFEIIRGYYFNDGFNNKINSVIKEIFKKRVELKEQKNPAEVAYKLIMNSGYGKSIMKEVEYEIVFFNNKEEMDIFVNRNYNWVIEFMNIEDSDIWRVKLINPINLHFNLCHIGVSILSMSKRIMNEVMCLGEDMKIQMYYQDTDSIHLNKGDELRLGNAFTKKYGRVLIGENMGQFHSDFELVDYKVKDEDGFEEKISCKDVYAKRSIFLGKKCYIDELVGTKENGTEKVDYHIRMKGVTNGSIKYTAKVNKCDVFALYEKLYKGEKINFDLTEGGNNNMNLKIHKDGIVETLKSFIREICF